MALPTSYLTSFKNVSDIFEALKSAQAPEIFTTKFLSDLDFKSSGDRLMIGVLKSLRFLDDTGKPTQRYFEFLDQTQSARVLAEGIRDAYSDLFMLNKKANEMSVADLKNKIKTLTQGKLSESVLSKMASTFSALTKLGDFSSEVPIKEVTPPLPETKVDTSESELDIRRSLNLGGLVYNIQIVLPESRDQAVYDALFRALRMHLI